MPRNDEADTTPDLRGGTDLVPLWGRWLTRRQLAAGLGISVNRIATLHRQGLRPHRVGGRNLYDIADVHDWIAGQQR